MNDDPENPPAFPRMHNNNPGMSLRDYFAAHCPITHGDAFHLISAQAEVGTPDCTKIMEAFCRMRYEYADVMLAERSK